MTRIVGWSYHGLLYGVQPKGGSGRESALLMGEVDGIAPPSTTALSRLEPSTPLLVDP